MCAFTRQRLCDPLAPFPPMQVHTAPVPSDPDTSSCNTSCGGRGAAGAAAIPSSCGAGAVLPAGAASAPLLRTQEQAGPVTAVASQAPVSTVGLHLYTVRGRTTRAVRP